LKTDLDNLDYLHSIQNILSRPTLLNELTLTGAQTSLSVFYPQTPLLTLSVPYDVMNAGNKISKLQNFEYFRATAHIKVMVNANPFTCGKLWVCYAPMDTLVNDKYRIDSKTRASVTSYPGMELDFQVNNTVEIEIPWTALLESAFLSNGYNLTETKLKIYAMGPIQGPAGFSVNMQVFGWLSDVILRGPTYRLPVPPPTLYSSSLPRATLQVNKEAKGPIEQVSGLVGKTAGVLKYVPFLTEIAAPVEWVSNSINKVASIFGLSRPVEGSGAPSRTIIPGRGMFQNVCADQSTMLAFSNDNSLGTESVFLRKEDEMDIQFVSARPGLIDVVSYTTTSTSDTLGDYACGPSIDHIKRSRRPDFGFEFDATCFEFTAQLFTLWRADLHFRVSVAKTAFHTGRLEIVFVPGPFGSSLPISFDSTNCYRTILDLSLQNEVDFVCPFVSNYEMLFTNVIDTPNEGQSSLKPFGFLYIKPLTPLLCPETVSQSVDIYVWKHATNVAFAGTANASAYPRVALPVPTSLPRANLQINVGVHDASPSFVAYGSENSGSTSLGVAQRVGGEILENLRPLTRAHRELAQSATSNSIFVSHILSDQMDYLSYLSSMYSYWRGGISYKFSYEGGSADALTPMVTQLERAFHEFGVSPTFSQLGANHLTYPTVTPIHEVQLPFFSATKRLLCNSNDGESEFYATNYMPSIRYIGPPARVYRAGKDDFSFGNLIGPTSLFLDITIP
jgi:hypothetical protein